MSPTRASGSTASPNRSDSSRTRRAAAFVSSSMPLRGSSARTMFSATVITGTSMKCWNTMPIPSSMAVLGESITTGSPFNRISPSSGLYIP